MRDFNDSVFKHVCDNAKWKTVTQCFLQVAIYKVAFKDQNGQNNRQLYTFSCARAYSKYLRINLLTKLKRKLFHNKSREYKSLWKCGGSAVIKILKLFISDLLWQEVKRQYQNARWNQKYYFEHCERGGRKTSAGRNRCAK